MANATASTDADASAMAALERGFHANTSSAASAVAMNGANQSAPEAVTTLMSSSPQVADASLKATAASLVNRDAMTMALMEAGQSSSANVKGGASASGTNSQVNPLSGASLAAGKLIAEDTLPLETAELETLDNDGFGVVKTGCDAACLIIEQSTVEQRRHSVQPSPCQSHRSVERHPR